MSPIDLTSDELAERLLLLSEAEPVCLLDSCGVGGGFLIAGVGPLFEERITDPEGGNALALFGKALDAAPAAVFTISYDLGLKLHGIGSRHSGTREPDIFAAGFRAIVFHDYSRGETLIEGDPGAAEAIRERLLSVRGNRAPSGEARTAAEIRCETARDEYLQRVEAIRELIRDGETYQVNLTQKFTVPVPGEHPGQSAFRRLRESHPSAYSAFIDRGPDQVVSISPERFLRISGRRIEAAPIKGTRRRTGDRQQDERLRRELVASQKDRAENIMITDLLRNDLGRVCEYGSVEVGSLCSLQELPSLYHLVSTVSGELRRDAGFADVLRALFPCGSITGAPKHRTMEIIDRIEPSSRGLSMGSIGISLDTGVFSDFARRAGVPAADRDGPYRDLSVAIRTMVIRDGFAEFNAGGGVVIDSNAAKEYEESLDKASAIFRALGAG